jgi:hypothetical protein
MVGASQKIVVLINNGVIRSSMVVPVRTRPPIHAAAQAR